MATEFCNSCDGYHIDVDCYGKPIRPVQHVTTIVHQIRPEHAQGNSELHHFHRWVCTCGAVGAWGHSLWANGSLRAVAIGASRHVQQVLWEESER